jgi:hypothetical protein
MWRTASLAVLALLLAVPLAAVRADDTGTVKATVTVPGDIAIEVSVPDRKIQAGNPFQIEARMNAASGASGNVELRYPDTILVRDGSLQLVTLKPGKSTTVRWSACSETPGLYVVMASFEGADGFVADSEAAVVEVTAKKKASCPKPWQ